MAISIGRAAARRADRKRLKFKHHATAITKAHANRGFAVKLSAAAGQFDDSTVTLVDTAGDLITGELCDVHDDGTCSVEVCDMIFRTDNAIVAGDLGKILVGRGTTDGDADIDTTTTTPLEGPIVYGGFTARDEGLVTPADVHFFRAQRY